MLEAQPSQTKNTNEVKNNVYAQGWQTLAAYCHNLGKGNASEKH